MDVIGDEYGALDVFFNRRENKAFALPPKGKIYIDELMFHYPDFPLRLYALRINEREDVVVLFNGGEKTSQTNELSTDLNLKFHEAQIFAKKIDEALKDGSIIIDENNRKLISFDGSEDIIL